MEENKMEKRDRIGRKELTPRNRLFLERIADGLPIVDAYRLAGYHGAPHTAHELKRQLRGELKAILEARGFSMEGLAAEVLKLQAMPLNMKLYPDGIPLSQKIQILRLQLQALKDDAPKAPSSPPNITAFIINRGAGSGPRVSVNKPVDTTAEAQDQGPQA